METEKNTAIYIQLEPKNVNYINRIMEGYEYLGVVSTLNRKEGIVVIRVTPDTLAEVHTILANLPIAVKYVTPE